MTDIDELEREVEREREREATAARAELESLYGFGDEVYSLLGEIAKITKAIDQRRAAAGVDRTTTPHNG